jgi:hypothetical protein
MKRLGITLAALLLAGCAWNRPTLRTEERGTNGMVRIQETRITSFALWPATSELAHQKASNGRTQTIGTDGLAQEGGGTNLVEGLKEVRGLIRDLKGGL